MRRGSSAWRRMFGAFAVAVVAAIGLVSFSATAALADGLPSPEVPPEQVRQDAKDILARPEYQEPPKTWADEVKEWLGERLADVFRNVAGGTGGPIMWVVLALLVGGLLYLLFRIRGSFRLGERREDDPLFVTELEAARSPVEWLTEAERLEANGQWKQALRCRYRALIGLLISEGVVRDIPGRTSGEFRAETRRRAPLVAASFASASELFDDAWYGDKQTGQVESARFRELADDVGRGVGSRLAKDERAAEDRAAPLRVTVDAE